MIFRIPLLLYLLANVAPSDAGILARGSGSVARVASRAHQRGAGLVRDLRLAYSSILIGRSDDGSSSQQPYCVNVASNGSSLTGGGDTGGGSRGGSSGTVQPSGTSSAAPAASSSAAAASSPWKLKQSYEGSSFFGGWSFFTDADPTGGTVDYVDGSAAQSANLTGVNSAGNAYMRVDTTPVVSGTRKSVRITTEFTYTQALVVLDAVHIPTGCGTWPAFWSNGPNWPAGGEIDIVEGVNTYTNDQVTLHTNTGCSLPSTDVSKLDIAGTLVSSQDCSVSGTGDTGCGVRSTATNAFGPGFNAMGGGVYTMKWDDTGITVHFFPRSSIPSDITSGAPNPSAWGTPIASFPSSSCNTTEFFYDHSAIFDTTLCGAWAGDGWGASGIPGQETSCASMTSTATCADYVLNNGAAFNEAYWEVKSVKIYQTS
ncbi:concanavalin A-like lectin/glucanase domain-containing protein [Fomitopsis serialis]|uniref:concanavalin A-like lectin/glucanase domain-containing protein n=1 Tax=Fomitopsis serialis TaxID=139415 RepID=UPI00200831CE|nr:concanavalin A-like lectin/glucanase domain-containing protein [Neoantrodia serialis]KAH9921398.1 concanavalin A-like lectin/glucanase domain-containing protein [Neoantrodia serialis]